jgi:3-oxoacyl-[acyl-carrier protein] reductase
MLRNRIALVTGASRGIGAATAKLLAANGAAVAVNYFRSEKAAGEVVEEIRRAGGKAMAVRADVRQEAEVKAMVAEVERQLGPIDTLVVNASIGFPMRPFIEYRWEDFEAKLTGELRAAFYCCQAVAPRMIERKGGCIVAVSSSLSRFPGQGFCAHSTAKSGLDGFVRSLALELGSAGIRVNAVGPGLTETDATTHLPPEAKQGAARSTPMRRIGQPGDIAGAVLMLASDHCRFVTGVYVPACGGALMP